MNALDLMHFFAAAPAEGDTRIAGFIFDRIGTSVVEFINEGSSTMIGIIGPVATSLLVIYVLLWGVAMASGQISEPFTDGMKRIIRMAVIIALALTAGIYQGTVADFFRTAPLELASQMTIPGATPVSDVDGMADMLDASMNKGFKVARKPWDAGDERNQASTFGISGEGLAFMGLAIMLYVIVVLVVAVAAGLVFVAYVSLAILLAVGPLFILFAIFPQTQRWFEAWLGQAVNYAVMFVLVALAAGLLFSILDAYFADLQTQSLSETLITTLKAIGLSVAMIGVLLQMNSVAAALGGGAAAQATGVAGKLAGAGMAAAMPAASMARGAVSGFRGKELAAATNARGAGHAAGRGMKAMARRTFSSRNTVQGT